MLTAASSHAPWIDQQWLAHVVFYGAWTLAGYPAVAVVAVLATAAGCALLAATMLRLGVAPPRMFAWTTAAIAICAMDYQIQAQNFGYPLFAVTLWLLIRDRQAPRPVPRTWLVVGVLAVWANLHGSVLLGTAVTVLYAAWRALTALARRDWRAGAGFTGLGAAALAAIACTPYGINVLGYYGRLIGNPVLSAYVGRWAPPDPSSPATWLLCALAAAAAVTTVRAWRHGVRPDPFLTMVVIVLLALAAIAARNQDWFAFGASLLAAETQARAHRAAPALAGGFVTAITATLAALALVSLTVLVTTPASQFESLPPRGAIATAAAIARRDPGARILGDAYTGTAMLWLQPAATIGRDGYDVRFGQYSSQQLRAYFRFLFVRGPRWQGVTRGYSIIVISRKSIRLRRALSRLPEWRIAYQDSEGLVFVRARQVR